MPHERNPLTRRTGVTLSDEREDWLRKYGVGFYMPTFAEDSGNPVDVNPLPVVGSQGDLESTAPLAAKEGAAEARSSKRGQRGG